MVFLMVSRAFSGQAEDEISVHHQPQLVAILGELAGAFDGRAFLDVLQNLLDRPIRSPRSKAGIPPLSWP